MTDVSQAESRLAGGQTQVSQAEATYKTSVAVYRQVIGVEPGTLSPGSPVDRFCPKTLEDGFALIDKHPSVATAMYGVDVAQLAVKVGEGALLPTLTVQGSAQKNWEPQIQVPETYTLSVLGQLSVPLYQGGAEYSAVRQAKEALGQRRTELDLARQQVRAGIVQAWSQVEATKSQIKSTEVQVKATEIALNGVREEARVGQRTTLDVLNAQQELVNARTALVAAQRDRIVASYTLLAAVGSLSTEVLRLPVNRYDAVTHYRQVRDSWGGLRTPDGK
jgi:outer membrane protein